MSSIQLGPITVAESWQPLLHPSILALSFPPVPSIDCDNCWMVGIGMFRPKIKCCSYLPSIPNFLLGELLEHGWSEGGRQNIKQWAEERGDPLMAHIPPVVAEEYTRPYEHVSQKPGCPLLDKEGRCTIYEHRPTYCLAFHCMYPPNSHVIGLWNSLASLLELQAALVSQYLIEKLGCDIPRLKAAWEQHTFEGAWDEAKLTPEARADIWQELGDPKEFYKACYHYILDNKDTIRESLVEYRKAQLIRQLQAENNVDQERIDAIHDEQATPSPKEPPADAQRAFAVDHRLSYDQHKWTVSENESFVLWYHQHAYGETTSAA